MMHVIQIVTFLAVTFTGIYYEWTPNSYVLALLGWVTAISLTGLIVRFADARQYGWKASSPPPITKDQKSSGNLTVLKWILYWLAMVLAFYAFTSFQRSSLQGVALMVLAIAALATALFVRRFIIVKNNRLMGLQHSPSSNELDVLSAGRHVRDSLEDRSRLRIGKDDR
jgi:hypothetical protein